MGSTLIFLCKLVSRSAVFLMLFLASKYLTENQFGSIIDVIVWSTVIGLIGSLGGGVNTQASLLNRDLKYLPSRNILLLFVLIQILLVLIFQNPPFAIVASLSGTMLVIINFIIAELRVNKKIITAEFYEFFVLFFPVSFCMIFSYLGNSVQSGYLLGLLTVLIILTMSKYKKIYPPPHVRTGSSDLLSNFVYGALIVIYANIELIYLSTFSQNTDEVDKIRLFFALKISFAFVALFSGLYNKVLNNLHETNSLQKVSKWITIACINFLIVFTFMKLISSLHLTNISWLESAYEEYSFIYYFLIVLTFNLFMGPFFIFILVENNYRYRGVSSLVLKLIIVKMTILFFVSSTFSIVEAIWFSLLFGAILFPLCYNFFFMKNSFYSFGVLGIILRKTS